MSNTSPETVLADDKNTFTIRSLTEQYDVRSAMKPVTDYNTLKLPNTEALVVKEIKNVY